MKICLEERIKTVHNVVVENPSSSYSPELTVCSDSMQFSWKPSSVGVLLGKVHIHREEMVEGVPVCSSPCNTCQYFANFASTISPFQFTFCCWSLLKQIPDIVSFLL